MIPMQILELAAGAGWNGIKRSPQFPSCGDQCSIALDPEFWRFLGKALGWPTEKIIVGPVLHEHDGQICGKVFCETVGIAHKAPAWKVAAHRFYDLILTSQSTEQFWEEILPATLEKK